jgi:hypothetical protein
VVELVDTLALEASAARHFSSSLNASTMISLRNSMNENSIGRREDGSLVDASTNAVVEIEAFKFWREAYSAVYPDDNFQNFLTNWRKVQEALIRP